MGKTQPEPKEAETNTADAPTEEQPVQTNPLGSLQSRLSQGAPAASSTAATSKAEQMRKKHPHRHSASNMSDNHVGPSRGRGNSASASTKTDRVQSTPLFQRMSGSPASATSRQSAPTAQTSTPKSTTDRLSRGQASNPLASLGAELRNLTARNSEAVPETPRESNVPLTPDTLDVPTTDLQEPSAGWGSTLFSFTGFAGLGVALGAVYYWFQRRFGGNTKPERKLRSWQVVRLVSAADDAFVQHSGYRPSREFDEVERSSVACAMTGQSLRPRKTRATKMSTLSPRFEDIQAYAREQLRPSATYLGSMEMPRASHEPSVWERYSKGGKLH